jgi:peptidoglycan/xylan/chitin deacetylase (PgdA/CDA1 family)
MIALMYHDVIEASQADSSGFPGQGAARYKLTPDAFREHLDALASALPALPITAAQLLAGERGRVLLTFDDGGRSAEPTAALLEAHGWRGHFFVTAKCINTAPFVSAEQIRNLHRAGHVIGSHSFSHPPRMSHCPWEELVSEWTQSCAILADIVGEAVTVASVPGGYYSRRVAQAAAAAGIRVLFNSEPTTRIYEVNGCIVVGRYTLYAWSSPAAAVALVSKWPVRRSLQTVAWQAKKFAKIVGGQSYLAMRHFLLSKTTPPK